MKTLTMLCALLLVGSCAAYASPKKAAPAKKWASYSSAPLDPSAAELSPSYLGNDCRGLAKTIASLSLQKGEFETTTAYRERIDAMGGRVIAGSIKLGDVVGFVPSDAVLSMLSEQYNADDQTLRIDDYIADGHQMVGGAFIANQKLETNRKFHRTYEASNAYGKTVAVDSSTWDTCAIAFVNVPHMSSPSANALSTTIQMTPDEARAARGNIAKIFVGNLAAPYRADFSDYLKPTIDSPREAAWSGDALVMQLVQVWFFNRQTGKVYKKLDIQYTP
jgi:hypothetical protein